MSYRKGSMEPRTVVVRGRYIQEFTFHVPAGTPDNEVEYLAWEYLNDQEDVHGELDLDPRDIEVLE